MGQKRSIKKATEKAEKEGSGTTANNEAANSTGPAKYSAKYPLFLLVCFLLILLWSGIKPHDYFTWFLEVIPAVIGAVILIMTYNRFRFTNLTYTFIFIEVSILCIGGHTTYAEMPLFNWLRDSFDLQRNYYDRVGHFFQGFTPALIAYEILLRKRVMQKLSWLPFVVVSVCLAVSACYEFFEWGAAVVSGEAATAFLGTQGDVWDTQWDMFLALLGATIAMLLFRKNLLASINSEESS